MQFIKQKNRKAPLTNANIKELEKLVLQPHD